MKFNKTLPLFALLAASTLAALPHSLRAQSEAAAQKPGNPPSAKTSAKSDEKTDKPETNPLPADKSVPQTMQIEGKTLHYTATVGTLPVKNAEGKPTAEVVFTSYTMAGPDRPVTFAFNGGPGAASVYLNLGAIGPKRVQFGAEGDSPSDPATLRDNPGTWLDFTDLVFIDPVGTGFSRSLVPMDETKKLFYGPDQDIAYLSKIVFDWLVKNDRLQSRKYLAGESYGGYRGPRLAAYLQSQIGVAVNGIVLVSPALAPAGGSGDISPLPFMTVLPSMVAANYERKGTLTQASMDEVIQYTRTEYVTDLMAGVTDPAATPRVVAKVTALTGLDPTYVKQSGGRLETQSFLREEFRETGKLGSRYDPNVTAYDPFPYAPYAGDQRPHPPLHHRSDHHGHGRLG